MAWMITKDHECGPGEESAAGTCSVGPPLTGKTHSFRLYDDDGILYYTGLVDDAGIDDDDTDAGLYTAYKWGEWYAGATDLRLFENGKYVSVYG